MIFDLAGAHAGYKPLIENTLGGLVDKYPWSRLKRVSLYQPRAADHSMGNADRPGEIQLNAYWFARDPAELQRAALARPEVWIGGRWILWHGAMLEEPLHVLTHEFFHVLSDSLPGYERWANEGWLAATAEPEKAVSGYSLADFDEFGAEEFTAAELEVSDAEHVAAVHQLLAEHS